MSDETRPVGPAERGSAAAARARELQQRRVDLGAGKPCTPETARSAQERAELAYDRAARAHLAASVGHHRAAMAHVRAAEVHERAIAQGFGDIEEHRRAAADHRRAAKENDIASVISAREANADFNAKKTQPQRKNVRDARNR
ncbi:hypothetical protein [Rhodococcoides kyotonense]|uniref:Colicin import membrane protein n=1 Tax=Rhodococcoides kyotonense TaxID=398843 RepID=A0A239J5C2_9NOCA|nr:hypothetical protein [Rhodococcus kyotonensis]SNT01005.1 hypothetical protein SAMN05421642_10857 [Rhodococcus kyotonensis]